MLWFDHGRGRQGSNTLNRQDAPSAHEDIGSAESSQEDQSRSRDLEDLIMHRLDEDKAQDVVLIDLKDKSSVADSLIVASGRSHRHVGRSPTTCCAR